MENLASYIIRASFSQERMTPYHVRGRLYIPEGSKVSYQSKDGKEEKVFDALEWPRWQAGCKHLRPCVAMCLTRVSRWPDTMAIIVMFHEASGKKKIRITSYLPSWSRTDHPKPALGRRIFLCTL
jgi:hypothetical protein